MVSMKVLTDEYEQREIVIFKAGEFSTPLVVIAEYALKRKLWELGYRVTKVEEEEEKEPLTDKKKYFQLIICPEKEMDEKDQQALVEVVDNDLKQFFKVRESQARWIIGWRDRKSKVSPCAGDLVFD